MHACISLSVGHAVIKTQHCNFEKNFKTQILLDVAVQAVGRSSGVKYSTSNIEAYIT